MDESCVELVRGALRFLGAPSGAMDESCVELVRGALRFPRGLPAPAPAAGPRAPRRPLPLDARGRALAVRNALRYFAPEHHAVLAPELARELLTHGHIYVFRLRPAVAPVGRPYSEYAGTSTAARCLRMMIDNNLDPAVAQFPHELVTYGGNGQCLSNWAQYWLVQLYLAKMSDEQTLVMYSGHPLGLFPSAPASPRVVVTNGMVVPSAGTREAYDELFALGNTQYGQMTAGSYCYIGPQGIVHGTTLTLLNAARKYLGSGNLAGRVLVTSGLGGMSGAQGKAAHVSGAIGVIAEVDEEPLRKRHAQGWVDEVVTDLDALVARIRAARQEHRGMAIAYLGNVVDVWERLAEEDEMLVELGSDQTSLHNPFLGGYVPVGMSVADAREMMTADAPAFRSAVQASLRRQVAAINKLASRGMRFYDYGNAFLLEAERAGADIAGAHGTGRRFRYPSYVQDIMGDIFALGFGPFRWVCASGDPADLAQTDAIAARFMRDELASDELPAEVAQQYEDNLRWVEGAQEAQLVVGTQARILYSDAAGRAGLAQAFNAAVASGDLKGPVVISRDHHDVSGTDSPFRETSDLRDGSESCADMSVQNCIGDAMRGATWVALHNGGGCGWGEVMNGGFGLVLDGSDDASHRAARMLHWDVNNGVARRAWAGNERARSAARRAQDKCPLMELTEPHQAEDTLVAEALAEAAKSGVGGPAASVVVAGSADEDCPAAQAA